MKKKHYEKPSVEVVELKQQQALLADSTTATMDTVWEEETLSREFGSESFDFE